MTRPLLYLAAPVHEATDADRALVVEAQARAWSLGWLPVWGHALLGGLGLDEGRDRDAIMGAAIDLLHACRALCLVGSRLTSGMESELREQILYHRPVYLASTLAAPKLDEDGFWAGDFDGTAWAQRCVPHANTIDERLVRQVAFVRARMESGA